MTREEKQKAIDALKISAPLMVTTQEEFNDYRKTLHMIMDWLEQEPCEDVVSRQAVKEQMIKYGFHAPDMTVTEFVEDLLSVSTEKTGYWIKIEPYPLQMHDYECSECLHETDDNTEKYCSECGCRIVGVKE